MWHYNLKFLKTDRAARGGQDEYADTRVVFRVPSARRRIPGILVDPEARVPSYRGAMLLPDRSRASCS